MMRLLIALHATLPAALVAAVLLHLWPPAGLPPLADRPEWASWALIGLWLLFSVAALPLRGARLWRVALVAAGVLLAVAGVSGVILGTRSAMAMGVSLALLGMVCAALAASIGPARVQAQRRVEVRPKKAHPTKAHPTKGHPDEPRSGAISPNTRSPSTAHPDEPRLDEPRFNKPRFNESHLSEPHLSEPHPIELLLGERHPDAAARTHAGHVTRAWRVRLAAQVGHASFWLATPAGHAPFWLAGGLAVESFRLAHIVATGAARPSGMVGLLLACLIALPAATLSNWLPRTSAALWLLAALGYAGLAVKAGLLQWTLASTLCAVAACAGLWARRRQQARRLGTLT